MTDATPTPEATIKSRLDALIEAKTRAEKIIASREEDVRIAEHERDGLADQIEGYQRALYLLGGVDE